MELGGEDPPVLRDHALYMATAARPQVLEALGHLHHVVGVILNAEERVLQLSNRPQKRVPFQYLRVAYHCLQPFDVLLPFHWAFELLGDELMPETYPHYLQLQRFFVSLLKEAGRLLHFFILVVD